MSNPSQTPSQYAQPERFQFTLETLVIIMVMSAMAFAILFALPDWMSAIGLLVAIFMVPTALLARIIYSRGYARAFAIGAMIPAGLVLYNLNELIFRMAATFTIEDAELLRGPIDIEGLRWMVGGSWVVEIVCGFTFMIAFGASRRAARQANNY